MNYVQLSTISWLLMSGMPALADEMTKYTLKELLDGHATGGVMKIVVEDADILAFREGGFKVSVFDNRNEVSAYSDPVFLECTKTSGVIGIFDVLEFAIEKATSIPSEVSGVIGDGIVSAAGYKGYTACVDEWSSRLDKFVANKRANLSEIHTAQLTKDTVDRVVSLINSQPAQNHGVRLYAGDGRKKVEVSVGKDPAKDLKIRGDETAAAIGELTEEIRKANAARLAQTLEREAQEKLQERVQAKRDAIAGGAAAMGVLARIAFKNDPVLAWRIESGASTTARIADSIVQLTGPNRLSDGAKVLLSANIASGALALVSLIGSKNSESAVIMKQLQSIQTQLGSLRKEMNHRFDRLEKMLVEIVKHLDARLDSIDKRLVDMDEKLDALANDTKNIYDISKESFKHIVSSEYKSGFRKCARPISQEVFSAETATKCFEDAINYGLDVAPLRVMSSGALYNPNLGVDQALLYAEELPHLSRLGYLDAALRYAKRDGTYPGFSVPVSSIVSPPDWADSVDMLSSYLASPQKFVALAQKGYTRDTILPEFASDIDDLLNRGIFAQDYVGSIRVAGVRFALERYLVLVESLKSALQTEVAEEMSKVDLGILSTQRRTYAELRGDRADTPFGTNGYMRYSLMFIDDDDFVVNAGPQAGKAWKTKSRRWAYNFMSELMHGGGEGTTVEIWTGYINDPNNFAKHVFQDVFSVEVTDYEEFLPEINAPYLAAVNVQDFTSTGLGALYKSFVKARSAPKVVATCQRVADAKAGIVLYANLLRSSYTEADVKWREALAALPGDDAASLCLHLSLPATTSAEAMPIDTYVVAREGEVFSSRSAVFLMEFERTNQNTNVDALDARISALESLKAEAASSAGLPR